MRVRKSSTPKKGRTAFAASLDELRYAVHCAFRADSAGIWRYLGNVKCALGLELSPKHAYRYLTYVLPVR